MVLQPDRLTTDKAGGVTNPARRYPAKEIAPANGAPAQAAIPLDNPDAQTAALATARGELD